MLPEPYSKLLTSYIDGELSARQRKVVVRLLHRSAEARALLRQLQADAARLRHLPRRHLDHDLSGEVVETISSMELPAVRLPIPRSRPVGGKAWAIAAGVLLAVGAASYFAFPLLVKKGRSEKQIVKKAPPRSDPLLPEKTNPTRWKQEPPKVDKDKLPPEFEDPFQPAPLIVEEKPDRKPKRQAAAPQIAHETKPNTAPKPPILGSGLNPESRQVAHPNVSFMALLHILEQKEPQERLRAKLHSDNALHLQLLCRDTNRGLEQLRRLLAQRGLHLLVEPDVQARLKKPQVSTKFILYAENIGPEELLSWLQQLRQADRQAAEKNKSPRQFGVVLVSSMSVKFRQQVSRFLDGKPRTSPSKSEDAKGKSPVPQGSRRLVLVLAYNEDGTPVHARPSLSREVKQFRDNRPGRVPGTLQIVVELSRDPL